jgi:hypothetical protein
MRISAASVCREAHRDRPAPQLAPLGIVAHRPQRQHLRRVPASLRRWHAAQDRVDPQEKFARLEGLGQIVVGARLEPGDPVAGFARAVSSRIGVARLAQRASG